MVSQKALENMFAVYYAAATAFDKDGRPGLFDALCDDFGHELHAWDAWYGDGEDPESRPDEYSPTMSELKRWLSAEGYKGVGGKNPRVVKL